MTFPEVEDAIAACRKHLDNSNSKGTQIEAYLTCYLLVLICRTFENEIRRLVVERAKLAKDEDIVTFMTNSISTYRSLKVSDIKGKLMGRFGKGHWDRFDEFLRNETTVVTGYSNIVANRHQVAHGGPVNMTLDELVQSYRNSEKVLAQLRTMLGV